MANPNVMRPSISRILRLQETRQWLPMTSTSASTAQPRIATSSFSTSATHSVRKTRDNNRLRGVSTMRRSGPREPLSVSWDALPKPARTKAKVVVDPNHGLYGFFYDRNKLLNTPTEDQSHGRAWEVEELRRKDWDDLHALWYVCLKERNRISTTSRERERRKIGFGAHEADERDQTVKKTMQRIKHVLTERYYLWEDARKLAAEDPKFDLSGSGPVYDPHRPSRSSPAKRRPKTKAVVVEAREASAEEELAGQEIEEGFKVADVEAESAEAGEKKKPEEKAKKAKKTNTTESKPAVSLPVPKL